jgi:hypothetical protein
MKRRKNLLFLKKKAGRLRKQKDFLNLGLGRWRRQSPRPIATEVFCFFFSKKKALLT